MAVDGLYDLYEDLDVYYYLMEFVAEYMYYIHLM